MSHVVKIQTQIRDRVAIERACDRLGLAKPVDGETALFSGAVVGTAVRLPGWVYPVVCDLTTGTLHFDNYEGRWGDVQELDRFRQAYAVEKVRLEARRRGHGVLEKPLADGSVQLTIQLGG